MVFVTASVGSKENVYSCLLFWTLVFPPGSQIINVFFSIPYFFVVAFSNL